MPPWKAGSASCLENEADRFRVRDELVALVAPWIAARTLVEVGAGFDAAGVLWGPYQSFRQLVEENSGSMLGAPLFQRIAQPGIGSYLTPGSPLDFTSIERRPPRPAPLLGQHTDEVLEEILGLSNSEIGRLHDDRIVAGPAK